MKKLITTSFFIFFVLLIDANFIHAQCPVIAPVPNNSCYQSVIADDSWCCYNSWDALCQGAYDGCNPGGGGGPVTAGDCPTAIPICTINNFSIDPNGFGTMNELCIGCVSNPSVNPSSANSGCLLSGELNSTWFSITVVASGTMNFSFGTPGPANCYDWAMWNYTNAATCTAIANNALAPVRCNWNGACNSYTGIGPTPPGGNASNFEPTMNVVAGQQFILCFSNYSSAVTNVPIAFTGTSNIDCIPLNISWNYFDAEDMNGYNKLTWSLNAEVNCSHYEIEKSFDGVNFQSIGQVESNGTTANEVNYEYLDYYPGNDLTYYRITQVKVDGNMDQSQIAMISQTNVIDFGLIQAYPNPVNDNFSMKLTVPNKGKVKLVVQSLDGTIVLSEDLFFDAGNNELIIPVEQFSSGMYIVNLKDEISSKELTVKMNVIH